MFDFAWSEIAVIGVVALVAIGPKDMPVAIKAVASMMKKLRRMAAEFQTHVDDMVRETELQDVRDQFNSLRKMDLRRTVEKSIDPDGAMRRTLRDDKLPPAPPTPAPASPAPPIDRAATVEICPAHEIARPLDQPEPPAAP